jgi:molecular chaperone HscB
MRSAGGESQPEKRPATCPSCRRPAISPLVCESCRALLPLRAGLDPFETLGLPRRFRVDADEIEQRYVALSRLLHPDRFLGRSAAEQAESLRRSAALNDAVAALRDPWKRAELILARHGLARPRSGRAVRPEFLAEVLELREQVAEARASGDQARLDEARSEVLRRRADLLAAMACVLDALEDATPAERQQALAREARGTLDEAAYVEKLLLEIRGEITAR